MEKKHEAKQRKMANEDDRAPLEPKRISIKQVLAELRDLHNDVAEMKASLSIHQDKIRKLEAQFKPPQRAVPQLRPSLTKSGSMTSSVPSSLDWEEEYCARCDSFGHNEGTH